MLQIINCEQNSNAWYESRLGIITASCFFKVLAKGDGKVRKKYMYELASEHIRHTRANVFSDEHMERGHDFEDVVRDLYMEHTGNEVVPCGFMLDIYGFSPDGLIGNDGTWEAKTKLPAIHIKALLDDEIPPEHVAQVQGGLLVSGRKFCDFTSYCPGLPLFIKRVERDNDYIDNLRAELDKFKRELQDVITKIMEKF